MNPKHTVALPHCHALPAEGVVARRDAGGHLHLEVCADVDRRAGGVCAHHPLAVGVVGEAADLPIDRVRHDNQPVIRVPALRLLDALRTA